MMTTAKSASVTYSEPYEFHWVEDYPSEPPQEEMWALDTDTYVYYVDEPWNGWGYDGATVDADMEISCQGEAATGSYSMTCIPTNDPWLPDVQVTNEWSSPIIGMKLSGLNPSVTVTFALSAISFGPVSASLVLTRNPAPYLPTRVIAISAPDSGESRQEDTNFAVQGTWYNLWSDSLNNFKIEISARHTSGPDQAWHAKTVIGPPLNSSNTWSTSIQMTDTGDVQILATLYRKVNGTFKRTSTVGPSGIIGSDWVFVNIF